MVTLGVTVKVRKDDESYIVYNLITKEYTEQNALERRKNISLIENARNKQKVRYMANYTL